MRLMQNTFQLGLLAATILVVLAPDAFAAEEIFQKRVAPLLQRRCLSCHSGAEPKGEFSLQTAEAALSGGYIEPGEASDSHLVELITPVDGSRSVCETLTGGFRNNTGTDHTSLGVVFSTSANRRRIG